jgi:predicted membrane protein
VSDQVAPHATRSQTHLPALATGLILMGAITADPRLLADSMGRPDHLLATAIAWAMTAGFVRGVGFLPRTAWLRSMFSGWACAIALVGAALIKTWQ